MAQIDIEPTSGPALSALQRYGPLALVVTLLAGLLVWVGTTSPDAVGVGTPTTTPAPGATVMGRDNLPEGVLPFGVAVEQGIEDDIDWGERCDTSIGRVELPIWPQPECFQPFSGTNAGASTTGVTADTIKVVVYTSQPDDPVLRFVYQQIGSSDTPDDVFETYVGFVEIFNTYYETYGRKVELVRYPATGTVIDATAAVADAETIARDIAPLLVIGGPNLNSAFAETLSANEVMCIACGPPQPASFYRDRDPFVWDVQKNAEQTLLSVAEYVGKRLAGNPAAFAGDPELVDRERVFGTVSVKSSEANPELAELFRDTLRSDYDVEIASAQTYALPTELATTGRDIITRLKEAGVTTVIFSGDPLGPQALTTIATEQEYFPEWVLGAVSLVDSATFSRTYDQRQWAHAFGPSNLFARLPASVSGPGFLYEWWFGEPPPASSTVVLITGPLQVLFGALQGAGPKLTPTAFRDALFAGEIIPSTPISAQVSFGNRGVWEATDYSALDDQTEVWWDPEAEGPTEVGEEGRGMWRYVDGGVRYLPGEWPTGQPDLFDPETATAVFTEAPPGAEIRDYEPLK